MHEEIDEGPLFEIMALGNEGKPVLAHCPTCSRVVGSGNATLAISKRGSVRMYLFCQMTEQTCCGSTLYLPPFFRSRSEAEDAAVEMDDQLQGEDVRPFGLYPLKTINTTSLRPRAFKCSDEERASRMGNR